jgi:uncharacterized protein (TIGR01777 family)
MKVLVTGATGFVGSALVAALRARGDTVVAVSRRAADNATITWDQLPAEIDSIDAVVNLAGETIAGRWSESKKKAIHDSRIEGTRAIVDAIKNAKRKPRVLVSCSAVGVYGETFEEVDESAPAGNDFLARVCVEWEAEADRAVAYGVRVVRPRLGIVVGRGGGVIKELAPMYRAGLGGPIGGGKQWWSWIHVDDVVGMITAALDNDAWHGPVNVVAGAVTQRDFSKTLGEVLGRPAVVPTPGFALKIMLGEGADPILLGQRVVAHRASSLGYVFAHPVLRSALANAVSRGESGTNRPQPAS